MEILLTNDDGILAEGIAAIYPFLTKLGNVTVVAPADSKSGAGHSITIHESLVCEKVDVRGIFTGYSVKGSPADCVKLALMELIEKPVDLVVSGMNDGANVGVNVYYSGTVAAAMEAAFYNIPAVALSTAHHEENMDFKAAAQQCSKVLKKLFPLSAGYVTNINIPSPAHGKIKGVKVVPQSTQGFEEHYIRQKTSQGQIVYRLNGGKHRQEDLLTDTVAFDDGYITITALHFDMTDYKQTRRIDELKL
jgi:5'-nucleotidase